MPSLGNDLASIRKHQNLTIENIHEATKIPVHILSSIEDDTIFTDINENTTYIRSYVRSYAKALKIDDELIVRSLDQVEAGRYDGLLHKELGGAPRKPTFSYDPGVRKKKEPEPEQEDRMEDETEEIESENTAMEKDTIADSHRMPPPPSVDSIDWADMGKKFTPLQSKSRIWIGIVILVIAAAATLFFLLYQSDGVSGINNSAEPNKNVTPALTPDSLQLNLREAENDTSTAEGNASLATNQGLENLPDTLSMLIYAAYGKLEPVRVYTDVMNNLNPYWIEEREAYQFEFVNTIRVRGQYSRMELLMNGHRIENFRQQFYSDDTRMLEINRIFFENDPKWLQSPPDSLGPGIPPPLSVQKRPIFN